MAGDAACGAGGGVAAPDSADATASMTGTANGAMKAMTAPPRSVARLEHRREDASRERIAGI
jgi:hypothetical protein